jgi:hypothetical protein
VTSKSLNVVAVRQQVEAALGREEFNSEIPSSWAQKAPLFRMDRHGSSCHYKVFQIPTILCQNLLMHTTVEFIDVTKEVQLEAHAYNFGPILQVNRQKEPYSHYSVTENSLSIASASPASPAFTETRSESYTTEDEELSRCKLRVTALEEAFRRDSSLGRHKIGRTLNVLNSSQIYFDPPKWPLEDPQEATLFHYYITKVAIFVSKFLLSKILALNSLKLIFTKFDFCDRDQHFALVIPQRARVCRTLFNAIMAISARHAHQTKSLNTPAYLADYYQARCFKTLIPILDDSAALMDETLLATVVILRLLEELDVSAGISDTQRHFHGGQSLVKLQERKGLGSGLRQASFWACLRQEIYISLKNHQPVQSNLDYYNEAFDCVEMAAGDEYIWSNYATLHCAEALRFSFGNEPVSKFQDVLKRMKHCRQCRPVSCEPVYYKESDEMWEDEDGSTGFPVIKYGASCHVMGEQYLTLGQIILVIHGFSIPSISLTSRARRDLVEKQAKKLIRVLCGVALSNPDTVAAILVTCMGIGLCGDLFTSRREQERLHDILVLTETQNGWPTKSLQEQLRQRWGWNA